jgi:ubiquinone/menaquinone biosynthesis C-methylase UbiE
MTDPIKIISKKEYLKKFGKPNQEEIWDSIANPWKTYVVKRVPIVEEFLKDKKGLVIDLGCGNGRNMFASKDLEYYGVDFSSVQLKHAEYRIKKEKIKAKVFHSKADNLDKKIFLDHMFDYGLFMATLHCIETKKEREDALKEFNRVLKKGALGLLSVWNSEDKRFTEVGNSGDIYMSWKEDGIPYMRYYYLFSKKELINSLTKVGFKVIREFDVREHDRFSKKNWVFLIQK